MSRCYFNNPKNCTGEIVLENPELYNKLYLPLFNDSGMMSAITPEFKGDLKLSQNHFHLHPVVTEELYNSMYSRNFWVVPKKGSPWSVTGVSADDLLKKAVKKSDKSKMIVKPGSIELIRDNNELGITSSAKAFVPSNGDNVEILVFTIKNNSSKSFEFNAIPAIPIYARSADNQRDHRQVTTLLNRIYPVYGGINVKPTMSFDERGHKENHYNYAVIAFDQDGKEAGKKCGSLQDFIGQGGSLLSPEGVYKGFQEVDLNELDGKEAIGTFLFKDYKIKKNESASIIIINVITDKEDDIKKWARKYNTIENVLSELEATNKYWQDKTNGIAFETGNLDFDNWFRWVNFQPFARKVYGCSFLPDFGYGRGGRGWRDLWQDCLALILTEPKETSELLFQNFAGIRMDGSNATIIGSKPGEFIADRNNITRTWMDHGVWPLITLNLYINQSGDIDILLKEQAYFKDLQSHRSQSKDNDWNSNYGNKLLTVQNKVYNGTILEHLIIQNLTQFYNVGEHNICKLEDADWNDGLDMAHNKGESVAFHCMYAHNIKLMAKYLEVIRDNKNVTTINLAKEVIALINSENKGNPNKKRKVLNTYMDSVKHKISGKKISVKIDDLIKDFREKNNIMSEIVLEKEVITTKSNDVYFNGYYNDDGKKVEGDNKNGVRMTLTGQVFPIMSGIANDEMIDKTYASAQKYLKDKKLGGFRLNTNFKELALNLGRAFSFSYGDKENGAFFSHMIVMFMYAMYSRGHVSKGHEIFKSIFNMCMDFEKSNILPSLPEYFDSNGRGAYLYLTGSASWMVLTMINQMFGIRSNIGDLVIAPKLVKEQFNKSDTLIAKTFFQGKRIKVQYINKTKKDYCDYFIAKVSINDKNLKVKDNKK
ncbi:GH36-type glycosyl hydrolase domain-containing protein, partial [Candidatus Margulisiibacteriota bacterium]